VVCGLVGRLVREKGYREVFAAAAQLRARLPQVRVVVIGPRDDDKADAITPIEIARAEREGGVRFVGLRHDVEAFYAAMDIHVLASHREGFPRSPMEASAMGVPVVATDIRGCRQAVDDGITGRLVPVRDAGALAAAIEALVLDSDERERMGRAARAKAIAEFDQRRVIETTLSVYDDLLSRRAHVDRPMHGNGRDRRVRDARSRPEPLTERPVNEVLIRFATEADASAMARLHATEIGEGFLPTLGTRFLTLLYRRIIRSASSFAFVADRGKGVVGFAAGAENLAALYRSFLLRDGAVAVLVSAPQLARSWRRVLETLRYPAQEAGELPPAELIAIAVAREARGFGLGHLLVDAVTAEFASRGVREARVVAGADNERALRLYRTCGFRPAATLQVHEGVSSEVLTWS
jgi:ribosomal protein S18 acetylase RimI-like enzyme